MLILKSSQLDAIFLDRELRIILKESLVSIFTMALPDSKSWISPEINAIITLVACEGGILLSSASYGLQLENLVYRDETASSTISIPPSKIQRWAHLIFNVIGMWAHERISIYMADNNWASSVKYSTYSGRIL